MKGGSIRLRLLIAAAVSVIAALALADLGLAYLFERHVERRVASELSTHLNQLIAGINVAGGAVKVNAAPTDPRFSVPLSGLYWQIEDVASSAFLRSRSLWDFTLLLPSDQLTEGALHTHEIAGPDNTLLVAVERRVRDATAGAERSFRVVVAEDHRDIETASRDFGVDLLPSLAMLAIFLVVAAWAQVAVGLQPLERLRRGLSEVVSGRATRLDAEVPVEVRPLAGEINRLLDAQAKALAKARSSAADLAHGLKTPLQVLSADVRTLRDKGETKIADEIGEVAGTIRRHVDRELARARIAPGARSRAARSRVAEVAARVVAVVKRTPAGEKLAFGIEAPPQLIVAVDETDLAEILGNLVENASRFAATSVRISSTETADTTTISVTDDGPGIPDSEKLTALSRGARLDLRGDGAGLGLAIVADVIEAYGGVFTLEDAKPGLRAVVSFPRGPSAGP
jgi:signal transduction histidine kinase